MANGTFRHGLAALLTALVVVLAGCIELLDDAPGPSRSASDPHAGSGPDPAPQPAQGHDFATPHGWDPETPPTPAKTPWFPIEDGRLPTIGEAKAFPDKFSRFIVKGNEGLEKVRAEGRLKGNGTPQNPYVLEKFYVEGELSFTSIDKALIVREGYVNGVLRLNYVGDQVYVHHVYASDLRVNENIKRDGPNTGGLFHDNKFAFVGQIRHFIGEFRDNEIGPRPQNAFSEFLSDTGVLRVAPGVVFNFDGFHGADVHHNRFVGQVDIKLHGHNHADCFVCPVHNHDLEAEFPGNHNHSAPDPALGFQSRHSVRYVSLLFRDNEIRVPDGIAMRYNDRNHAGDDRTANSEPNKHLNDPHVHYQDITIRDNRFVGGQLVVDVLNAPDERHPIQNLGILRLWNNSVDVHYERTVSMPQPPKLLHGIHVRAADGLELRAYENQVSFREVRDEEPEDLVMRALSPVPQLRGFQLDTFDASNLTLRANIVETGNLGVFAQRFTDSVHWRLVQNDFRTEKPWQAQDTKHPPEEE